MEETQDSTAKIKSPLISVNLSTFRQFFVSTSRLLKIFASFVGKFEFVPKASYYFSI